MHPGNNKILNTEQGISSHLPYAALEKDDIILTHQEDRIRIWKLNGIPVDVADRQQLDLALAQRMALFAHLPYGHECRIQHTMLRLRQPEVKAVPLESKFAEKMLAAYYKGFISNPRYENTHYLSLIHRLPLTQRNVTQQLRHRDNQEAYHQRKQQAWQHIEESSRFIEQQLVDYGIKRLGTEVGGVHAGLQFLSRLLNWQESPMFAKDQNIGTYLPKVRLFFGEKALEIYDEATGQRWYAALLAVKGYATTETYPGLLDGLLTLPIELCLTQSFTLIPTQQAREQLTLHQRRLIAADDPDQRGFEQLQGALGAIVAGDYALGWHQLSVMVVTTDLQLLDDQVAIVHHELLHVGLIAVRETLLIEPLYWSQFPGNHLYLFRKITLHSGNMACLASLHTKSTGNTKPYWGAPLLLLRTPQQSGYWFNFHVDGRDIGDTLILGEKGSGKTLLLTMLATAALQFKPRIFFFDKDFGAENWIHAVKGNHIILGTGDTAGLNPLQLPDTPSNRHFLHQWLRSLLETFGPPLTETEDTQIHLAIQHNYEHLSYTQRSLSHLQTALGTSGPGTLRNRLRHWLGAGEYAYYFDNPQDTLDLTHNVSGFEMHYLLQDNQTPARLPVLLYLFHRIRLALECSDKRPTLIILDEAWALLANEYFAKEIKNWLLTLRKLNAITIFATQNPADILNHSITPILVAETVTKILYKPNAPSAEIYQKGLHLSSGEYQSLCQIPSGSRAFLVKQPDHAIIAQLDLNDMTGFIPILSSRPQQRQEMIAIRKSNPENWWEQT
jgi:type IV secretion system protein VirB4